MREEEIRKQMIEDLYKRRPSKYSRVKKRRRKTLLRLVWFGCLILGLCLLVLSGKHIYTWMKDSNHTKKQQKELSQQIRVDEIPASVEDELINPPEDKDNDYWNYMKLPLVNVDFNELLIKNKDTVGFLKVNGTNINYPVVQTTNNSYYLTHSYDKSKNDAGWVFLDYRNDLNDLQDNTIIYAHGRYDTTMFGSLKNIFKNNWYQNTENYILHLSTPTYNSLWQIFSVYSIPTETYYLTSRFGSTESHQKFIDTITSRSKFPFNAEVTVQDKILTLSTCYNKKDKVVLHARLIKRQMK